MKLSTAALFFTPAVVAFAPPQAAFRSNPALFATETAAEKTVRVVYITYT